MEESITMYRDYGITEWREKCLVLTSIEKAAVERDLQDEINSPLAAIVKLPFPHFAAIYLQRFPSAINLIKDPAIGYKLYMLSDPALRLVIEEHRNPTKIRSTLQKEMQISPNTTDEIDQILHIPLEDSLKIISSKENNVVREKKFYYLTQYIDLKEAKRIGLSQALVFELDGVDGFELEKKLSLLNPIARTIVALSIGLYGEHRHTLKDISDCIKIPPQKIKKIHDFLLPLLLKTRGEMAHIIGLKSGIFGMDDTREYTNLTYRELDISMELAYIKAHLNERDRLVLSSYSKKEIDIYLASKYLFKTPASLATNMSLSLEEARNRLGL